MSVAAAEPGQKLGASRASLALVVTASSAGTAFEWYDFFVFGTLTSIIARQFTGDSAAAGFLFTLGAFAAGFFVRPFGALFFGRLGDRNGRKGAFLFTIALMGGATMAIGLLPTASQIGFAAPVLLVATRILQGFAIGGEYGGAAIYVAEHAPDGRRGFFTSWIQTTATAGLVLALVVVLGTRSLIGEAAFQDWGWRIPFLASGALLAVSLWIRLKLSESPVFLRMKAEGGAARAPLKEAFRGANLRRAIVALLSILLAQGAVWYAANFYAQFFLERVLKVPGPLVNALVVAAVVLSAGFYVLFGWLSDWVGRKPVMLFGMILTVAALFPGFHLMTKAANPALQAAIVAAPVTVSADPADCSLQFDPLGRAQFTSACDVARRILSDAGAPYRNARGPAGAPAVVRVGSAEVVSQSLAGLDARAAKARRAEVEAGVRRALKDAGYPAAADPQRIDVVVIFAVLMVFMVGAAALYGPQAAALVELFPTRVRYTAFGTAYNIGTGWVGGFLPVTAFAMVAASGDLYFGLWYPIAFTVVSIICTVVLLPETKGRPLD